MIAENQAVIKFPTKIFALEILAILFAVIQFAGSVWPSARPKIELQEMVYPEVSPLPFNTQAPARETGEWIMMDGASRRMPTPPNCIKDCRWIIQEAIYEEGHVVDVNLVEKGIVKANGQALEIQVMDYPDLMILAEETDTAWITSIEVAKPIWGNGVGRFMVDALNRALALMAAKDGVDRVYVVFNDVAGWGNSIYSWLLTQNMEIVAWGDDWFVFVVEAYR